jgi:hypothetical protein
MLIEKYQLLYGVSFFHQQPVLAKFIYQPTSTITVYKMDYTVAHLLKARIVESQQPAITRHWPVNSNKGIVFSAQSVLVAAHTTMK